MADQIRVTRDDVPTGASPTGLRPTPTDPARQLPAEAGARPDAPSGSEVPDYDDPRSARRDIEATRARMSDTLDEIEDVLVRKKEAIQNRLDVLAPVRENPWPAMGGALAAGLLLGLLTGGGDDEDEDDDEFEHRPHRGRSRDDHDWHRRTEILEERTRRLLSIAREQEKEIRRLRGKKKKRRDGEGKLERVASRARDEFEDLTGGPAEDADHSGSGGDGMLKSLEERLTHFVTEAVREFVRRR